MPGVILFNSWPSEIPGFLCWSSCPKLHFTFFSLMCVWLWPIYQPAHSHPVSLLLLHQSETERNKLKVHPKLKGLHSKHRKTLSILVTFPEFDKILYKQGISFLVESNEFKFCRQLAFLAVRGSLRSHGYFKRLCQNFGLLQWPKILCNLWPAAYWCCYKIGKAVAGHKGRENIVPFVGLHLQVYNLLLKNRQKLFSSLSQNLISL